MTNKVNPIPEGYHTVTPYLIMRNASRAIDFYKDAFGAKELFRMPAPGDRIGHAELQIGNSRVMLADEHPEMGIVGPETRGGATQSLMLYVEDVDTMFDRAVKTGAKVDRPVSNQFYGDRLGSLTDPFGHVWHIATHVEDVSEEEMQRRAAEQHKG
ncbi:MAG TPA: VOC family protein [Thermoanaerobaculia bacterium]|nr:VOC family protein [Thermoanaerobaculia bacterium]